MQDHSTGGAAVEVSRRERKKQATRQAIHEAAFDLAEEHGLGGFTVEAVTEKADVAQRTFFNYFASKEEAVIGWNPDFASGFASALETRPAGEKVLDSLRAVISEHLLDKDLTVEFFRRRMALIRSDQTLTGYQASKWVDLECRLAEVIAKRVGGGEEAATYGQMVASVVTAAVRSAVLRWSEEGGTKKVSQLIDDIFDWLAAGLPEPGKGAREGKK